MRVFVVGTTGQLAIELQRASRPSQLELLRPAKLDLSDAAQVSRTLDELGPQLVINAGAYTAVDRAESESELAFAVNARGPGLLAHWCQQHGSVLLHVSTDYVFDGTKAGAYVEDDTPNPLSVYGKSKLAGELAVRAGLEHHVILRTSWIFSAHGQNFVKTILRLSRERPELRIVADQLGRPTSAAQLAGSIIVLASQLAERRELTWGTYHVAGHGRASWYDLAVAILEERPASLGAAPRLVPITTREYPTPAHRPQNSELDTSRFEATFEHRLAPWRDELASVVRELVNANPASGSAAPA